jgi:hypothetical protein
MAKYIVEENNYKPYVKNYVFPLLNLIPGIVWSIPLHQKLFPDAGWWMTFGLCAVFVIMYLFLSFTPIIAAAPCVAGVVMFTALFWTFADYIGNTTVKIVVKAVILLIAIMVEFCIFGNATLPWMEKKFPNKPRIRKVEE